jgi:hypothetical protein
VADVVRFARLEERGHAFLVVFGAEELGERRRDPAAESAEVGGEPTFR